MERYQMTREGLANLEAEIARLEGDERHRIAQQIKTAREFGDLKENAEYHAAKEAQGHLETRILQLRERLRGAEVVEAANGDVVAFGSTVELVDEDSGRTLSYTLVSATEADASAGKLSVETPVAEALIGRRAGDVAEVATPRGTRRLRLTRVG